MRNFLLIFTLAFIPLSAAAEITRGCGGAIFVQNLPDGSFRESERIMDLNASGRCSGVSTANNCRVLARLALLECYDALWAERNAHVVPAACKPGFDTDSNRVNWTRFIGIYVNLPGGADSWIDRVRREACCNPRQFDDVTVSIRWIITGDTGCWGDSGASTGFLNPNYTLNCQRQRLRGICGQVPQRTNPE